MHGDDDGGYWLLASISKCPIFKMGVGGVLGEQFLLDCDGIQKEDVGDFPSADVLYVHEHEWLDSIFLTPGVLHLR